VFYGSVRAPAEAVAGKTRLTLSFTGPKEWGVASAVVEIPIGNPASKTP
jgi:hypothetical protein